MHVTHQGQDGLLASRPCHSSVFRAASASTSATEAAVSSAAAAETPAQVHISAASKTVNVLAMNTNLPQPVVIEHE